MSVFEAILIGLVQGLTEFLPISSSGHTILMGKLLDVEVSLGFELLIHTASLLAVIIVLNKPVVALIKKPFSKKARLIVAATIPTVIVFAIFKDFFESTFDGQFLAVCFLLSAMLILLSGFRRQPNPCYEMGYFDAIIVGAVQGLAGLPGLSRSGSTISTGIMLGAKRENAAEFSFLLSIPIIVGSFAIEFIGGIKNGGMNLSLIPSIFGFLAAFISGYFALKFMISRLNKYFDYFAIYLLALAIFLFLDSVFLHWL